MIAVRAATATDLPYLWDLSHKEGETIGFIPAAGYERVISGAEPGSRLWLATVDCEPVGFLYATAGPLGGSLHITQLVIQRDARRREYATVLDTQVEDYARRIQRQGIRLRVGAELEATAFWDALGYEVRRVEPGGRRRNRTIECRYRPLAGGLAL